MRSFLSCYRVLTGWIRRTRTVLADFMIQEISLLSKSRQRWLGIFA